MSVKTVREVYELLPTNGDIGVEIEAEAKGPKDFPTNAIPAIWKATNDGSLRGISIEYVMREPVHITAVEPAITKLAKSLETYGTEVKYSFRAGVHVHVNCQQMTMNQVLMYAAVYYTVENILMNWCGNDRVGNHFCLRAQDAEGVLSYVGDSFRRGHYGNLGNNNIRYASMNFASLPKYGSLEFRGLGTEPGFKKIIIWAELLYSLKAKSMEFENIPSLLERFSMATPEEWLKDILGDFYNEVKDQPELETNTWRGIRTAQDLLFYSL